MKKISHRAGFTLIEVVMAAGIFAMASVIVSVAFVNTARNQKRILLENALFDDSRFIMERLINEIKDNTIDYEEYYNQHVVVVDLDETEYGKNYGSYAKRFYNPGTDEAYGALCNDDDVTEVAHRGVPPEGCVILRDTIDINTGQNPFLPTPPQEGGFDNADYQTQSNAFCDLDVDGAECDPLFFQQLYRQPELYLINKEGDTKTIFVREKIGDDPEEFALSMVKLSGVDSADPDTLIDEFSCHLDFSCSGGADLEEGQYPLKNDAEDFAEAEVLGEDFVPISPQRVTVKALHFYVSPLDDPRKAFSEGTNDIQMQPHVTVVMTIGLADEYKRQVPGEKGFEITLQTTISSGVYEEVIGY